MRKSNQAPNLATAGAPTEKQGNSEAERGDDHSNEARLPKGEFKKSDDDPVSAHKSQDQDHPTTISPSTKLWAEKLRPVQEKQQRG